RKGERCAGHDSRDRLHGRYVDLYRAARYGQIPAYHSAQHLSSRRSAAHLGRARVGELARVECRGRHRVMQAPAVQWCAERAQQLGLRGRHLVIAVPWIWLMLFFLIPFVIVVKISFAPSVFVGQPPYGPLLEWTKDHYVLVKLNIQNYLDLGGK